MFVQDTSESPTPTPAQSHTPIFDIPSTKEDSRIASPKSSGSAANAGQNAASQLHELPHEVLDDILNYLIHDTPKLLPFEQRASLSFESFASEPPIPPDTKSIFNFRNVCRKFWGLGRSRVFTRVNVRSSRKSFSDITWLAQKPEIAQEVKKLSYMVHDAYPQDEKLWNQLLLEMQTATAHCQLRCSRITPASNMTPASIRKVEAELEMNRKNEALVREVMERVEDQRQILENQLDATALLSLLAAFKNLQQIRLMRNEDMLDRRWQNFLRARPAAMRYEFETSKWTFACERATELLGRAYVASGCNAYRFSSRFMDPPSEWLLKAIAAAGSSQTPDAATPINEPPQRPRVAILDSEMIFRNEALDSDSRTDTSDTESPTPIADTSMAPISRFSSRLICLELQLDDSDDLSEKMLKLSKGFRAIFHSATKVEGLHIGLRRPISVPLESIFHDVVWRNLSYIGFSRWNLPSDQIFGFIRRHKHSLRSVRFREVRLTEGRWIEIVKLLRLELKLNWVSFRQVGYEPMIGGGPVPEPAYGGGFGLLRPLPEDDYESSSSDSSDGIGDHAGTGNEAAMATEEEEASASENNESEGPVDYGLERDEPVGVVDLDTDESNSSVNEEPEASVGGNDEGTSVMELYSGISTVSENQPANLLDDDDSVGSIVDSDAGDSEVGVNEVALDDKTMVQHSSATDKPDRGCDCENGYGWDDLQDDDGLDPTKAQWKRWERWVVRACSTHDPQLP